jgi:uncharacterized membrane protein
MGIGLGVFLALVGLVIELDVIEWDIPRVDDDALGWLLIIAGIVAIVLSLVVWMSHGRRRVVVDRAAEDDRYVP